MASQDAMNREGGEADHLTVTQSDETRPATPASQTAAVLVSAGKRPSPGGNAEVPAEVPTDIPKRPRAAADSAEGTEGRRELPKDALGTPERPGRSPNLQNNIQTTPSSFDEYDPARGSHQNLGSPAEPDHDVIVR